MPVYQFPMMKPLNAYESGDIMMTPPYTQTDVAEIYAQSYEEATQIYEMETKRRHLERMREEKERWKARYYQIPPDMMSSWNYCVGVDTGKFYPPPPVHKCLVAECKESHLDFQKGVLEYYKERHPDIAKKCECKNIMCHIEQIKNKLK